VAGFRDEIVPGLVIIIIIIIIIIILVTSGIIYFCLARKREFRAKRKEKPTAVTGR